jgi:CDP-diacylglycerol---serine O-phosphatidyltransferase
VLAFVIGLRTTLDTLILCLFICGGIARLARFNVTTHLVPKDDTGKSKYFQGLPIPSSLILVVLMWYWTETGAVVGGTVPGEMFKIFGVSAHWFSIVWAGWTLCMVSHRLKVPKL